MSTAGPTSLEALGGMYSTLVRWYMCAAVAGVALFLLTSDRPLVLNLAIVAACILGAIWMFWGCFVMIGLQIKYHGHTPLIASGVRFFFWFFLAGLLLALIQGPRGDSLWPCMLLIAPAVSLGVLKAWVQVKSKKHHVPQTAGEAGDPNVGPSG